MERLKPCPFCGGEAVLLTQDDAYWVQCVTNGDGLMSGCLSRTSVYKRYESIPELDCDPIEKAIAAWNRRADDGQ